MSEELRNCPFCKTEDGETLGRVARNLYVAIVSPDEEFVVCNGCGATGPPKESEADAAAAWNRRPSPEAGWVCSGCDYKGAGVIVGGVQCPECEAWMRPLPAAPEGEAE